jgi:hypothetical protein
MWISYVNILSIRYKSLQIYGIKPMFDINTTITFPPLRTASGLVNITVRWPTDEEWSAHRKRRRILQRQLGRGASITDVESADADSRLYEVIKQNGAPPLSVAEASFVVTNISLCDVLGVELRAEDAEVQLETVMGAVTHTVRIPTMDQVRKLQKATQLISLPNNLSQYRPSLEAAVALWEQCTGRVEGYTGPVPNVHKDVAIRAVVAAIEQEAVPSHGESNF